MRKIMIFVASFVVLSLSANAKHIVVDLSKQRACAYEGGRPAFCGNISSGKPGHRTPTGRFRVLEKDVDHVSSKYPEPNGGAKMHYMLRLTSGGIAMHLGHVPNYPASHGCIRMQNGFAQRMYRWASVGTPVRVVGRPPYRVSRSSTGTHRSGTRRVYHATATDILSEFMGYKVRKNTRRRVRRHRVTHRKKTHRSRSYHRSRKHRRSRTHRRRHHRTHVQTILAAR